MTTAPFFKIQPGPSLRIVDDPAALDPEDLDALHGRLLVWEPPRTGHRYVVSADVAEGVNKDRSSLDVIRVGTFDLPDEQVAHFVSALISPHDFAYVVDQAGRLFQDEDGNEALVAVECNGHGIATQNELQYHLGYSNFFRWRYYDSDSIERSYSHKLGWWTNTRTRPLIITNFREALKKVDPHTGRPDLVVRSPITLEEIRSLYVPPGMPAWMAAAGPNAHDDAVMSCAIGAWVSRDMYLGERESVADGRRRRSEEAARREAAESRRGKFDFQNTDATTADMDEVRGVSADGDEDHGYAGY